MWHLRGYWIDWFDTDITSIDLRRTDQSENRTLCSLVSPCLASYLILYDHIWSYLILHDSLHLFDPVWTYRIWSDPAWPYRILSDLTACCGSGTSHWRCTRLLCKKREHMMALIIGVQYENWKQAEEKVIKGNKRYSSSSSSSFCSSLYYYYYYYCCCCCCC